MARKVTAGNMKTILVRLALCALIWVSGLMARPAWIELSHPFNNETPYWPGLPTFNLTTMFDGFEPFGFYVLMYHYGAPEHGGTHMDAPRHFAERKWTTDEIPLDRLIGPAIKVDISSKAAQNADAELTPSDLQAWEEKHGRIPDDVILLVFSDWARFWPDRKTFMGTDTANASLLHFPGIHPNASRWLVKNRKIKMVGIDTPSLDNGQSKTYESHRILLNENIPGLENVAHMDKLPAKGFTLYAAPMFITGGSGGPCRIFARLDDEDEKDCIGSSAVKFKGEALFLGITLFLLFGSLPYP